MVIFVNRRAKNYRDTVISQIYTEEYDTHPVDLGSNVEDILNLFFETEKFQ